MPPAPDKPLLTAQEIIAATRLGKNTVYSGIANGQIPSVVIGSRRYVPRKWLNDLIGTTDSEERKVETP